MSDESSYIVAGWVAALEVALRAGDWRSAAEVGEELRRRGVAVSIPGLGERLRMGPEPKHEGARDE